MQEFNMSELYEGMQSEMLQKMVVGRSAFGHPVMKGDDTEVNWKSWFAEYLPRRYKIDKAIIVDSNGVQSEQIDLVIYDSQYSYMIFKHGENLVIPAESVYAIFEVKQSLNKENMEYARKKAESVRKLYRTSAPIRYAGGEYNPKPLHEIVAGLLTTNSDWKSPIEENVLKYIHGKTKEERLDFVCSINNNTFVVENNVFLSEYKKESKPLIRISETEKCLVYLLLNLLKRLQDIGTVPAIDFTQYAKLIDSKVYQEG